MNFLLANYNFFPIHKGGSEHYVLNQAKYLLDKGHYCEVISGFDINANIDYKIAYEDSNAVIVTYYYKDILVNGIFSKRKNNKRSIYSRRNRSIRKAVFKYFSARSIKFDNLELHGFSSSIGLDLIDNLKKLNPTIFIRYYNHVAVSCPKGTYLKNGSECSVQPSIQTCVRCIQADSNDIKLLSLLSSTRILPLLFPSSAVRNRIVKLAISSFNQLLGKVNEQIVFSNNLNTKIKKFSNSADTKVLRHGIPKEFLTQKTSNSRNAGDIQFGYLGRLLKIKGFNVLAEAWLKKNVVANEFLVIAGEEPLINTQASELLGLLVKRKDVKHLGYLSGDQLQSYLDNIDFLIVPSQCVETGPLVIHEAISRGCNVIGSNIGGVKELCSYYNQQVFEFNDSNDLLNKIDNAVLRPLNRAKVIDNNTHFDLVFNG